MPKPPPIDMNKVSQDVGQRFDRTVGQYFPAAAATGAAFSIPGMASKGPLLSRLAGSATGGALGGAGGVGLLEEDPSLQDTLIGAGLGAVGGPAAEAALGPILQRLLPKITGKLPSEKVFQQGDELIRQADVEQSLPAVTDEAKLTEIQEMLRRKKAGIEPEVYRGPPIVHEGAFTPEESAAWREFLESYDSQGPAPAAPRIGPEGPIPNTPLSGPREVAFGSAAQPKARGGTGIMSPEEQAAEVESIRRMLGEGTQNQRPPLESTYISDTIRNRPPLR